MHIFPGGQPECNYPSGQPGAISGHLCEQHLRHPAADAEIGFAELDAQRTRGARVATVIAGAIMAGLIVTAPIWLQALSRSPETSGQLARSAQNGRTACLFRSIIAWADNTVMSRSRQQPGSSLNSDRSTL